MRLFGTSLKPLEIWRGDVTLDDAREFGGSLLATLARGGAGSFVRRVGLRPDDVLVLYEMETCPYSRLAREALSELDLDVLVKPCPEGEPTHRGELMRLRGKIEFPYLIDLDAGVQVADSKQIVRHLYHRYGGLAPRRWLEGSPLSRASSKLASKLRGGPLQYRKPARLPAHPLVLWNYEGSPYCRIVRERLGELGLTYISRNLARRSPRRTAYVMSYGRMQVPRLDDPNTGVGVFETQAILDYVESLYGAARSARVTPLYAAQRHAPRF